MRQKLLAFMNEEAGGPDRGDGQNPSGLSTVQQATPASTDNHPARPPLLNQILQKETLNAAWKQVRANGGAPGIDGVTVDDFPDWIREHWPGIERAIREGRYTPQPVRRKDIRKPTGGWRMLGIHTVLDRLIQTAIVLALTPLLDPTFSEHSYGFRPGRGAHQAVRQARAHVRDGFRWVVDIDLSTFFDRVNHDILMNRLARRIQDKPLLKLIRGYLSAGIMTNGVVVTRETGTPQGGPLSPLLANVLLDEWDKELETRGHRFVRYADDCNIYVRSRKAGERVLASCRRFLEERLRLKVNERKSAVDRPWRRKFLGFSVTHGKRNPKIRLHKKTLHRFREHVREITRRNRGISLKRMIAELNRFLRGWLGYFRLVETPSRLQQLDGWVRRKLRCFLMKQWRPGRGRRRALARLGVTRAGAISWSRKGPWRLARTKQAHKGLNVAFFHRQGLFNLTTQWRTFAKVA